MEDERGTYPLAGAAALERMTGRYFVAADTGGTFTDFVALDG